jgi:hypothetical protein
MNAWQLLARSCVGGAALALAACAQQGPGPLYLWDTFPKNQYDSLLRNGASPVEQITSLEAQAEKARAAGAALPPGFRAHLGMLKLSVGDAGRARELWLAEEEAFPESAPYMNQLLKRLDAQSTSPTKMENPA